MKKKDQSNPSGLTKVYRFLQALWLAVEPWYGCHSSTQYRTLELSNGVKTLGGHLTGFLSALPSRKVSAPFRAQCLCVSALPVPAVDWCML